MSKTSTYDVIVIGAGSAGFSAAEEARRLGASVCLVEKGKLGGECPNWACVPSKALLRGAKLMREARAAERFGVKTGAVSLSLPDAFAYRSKVVASITGGGERGARYERLTARAGMDVVYGEAAFTDPYALEVGEKRLIGKAFVIATGTEEFLPPVPGLSDIGYLTSKTVHELTRAPKSIAIVGGGPVGCEYATFFSACGTRVVLIQSAPRLLNREDPEISALARKTLESQGVEVACGAKLVEVINGRGGVYGLKTEGADGNLPAGRQDATHAVEAVLVAAGKRAAVAGLNLADAGASLDAQGFVKTDRSARTNLKHVFAAGDVDGGSLFTHVAHHEGVVAGHNAALVARGKRAGFQQVDERVVPRVTFVDPEVASVGFTAEEAKAKFKLKKVLVGRFPIQALGRAATDHAAEGMVKLVAHPKTGKLLGGHIVAERAGEMIHEVALAIHLGATAEKLGSMIHAYPTYSEAVLAAANSLVTE
ncbi:NAD(P)/FAD-dependent oxidoreductase [Patescibacteria group bacterium]|nr:MAG: NAD(P)/FAD-dependent oxidoreductase [Patescibacteria group bacterium]